MLAELVSFHAERAVVHIGDVYIKADTDAERRDREVAALAAVNVPRPQVLWHRRATVSLLALSAAAGVPLGSLGGPSPHPDAMWCMAGHVARQVHDGPIPAYLAAQSEYRSENLEQLEEWLLTRRVAQPRLIAEHAARARAFRDSAANDCLIHGDLQPAHVLIDDDRISGVIDWADTGTGDRHYDLAVLTARHPERLGAVVDGYGTPIDSDRISGYWSWRIWDPFGGCSSTTSTPPEPLERSPTPTAVGSPAFDLATARHDPGRRSLLRRCLAEFTRARRAQAAAACRRRGGHQAQLRAQLRGRRTSSGQARPRPSHDR